MHRDIVLIATFFVLFTNIDNADAKICPTLDIRNNLQALEKLRNCTVIMGHLHVVLIDTVTDSSVYQEFSFPELTEIVDYLMVFHITQLSSIGKLFPNLRIIRGRNVFVGYALIVYSMPDLEEIGLTNLQYIGRGGVIVDYCPNLCYVETVDWTAIGASTLLNGAKCKDQFCPTECHGHCWNNYNCQNMSRFFCEHFQDGDKCVETCPKSKVTNYATRTCMTKEECTTMLNGTWWILNNACVDTCPPFYYRNDTVEGRCVYMPQKECNGTVVDTMDSLRDLRGCTHIKGSLEIRVAQHNAETSLVENLGNIVSISGYLKVGRSKAIRSLEFLKNLTIIKGETLDNNKYSLFVFENQNLQRLWNFNKNFNLTILTGKMAFHDNPQLCLSEIKKLEDASGINSKTDMEISQYSNGYKSVCNQRDMVINITEIHPTNITLSWLRTAVTDNETIIGYTVYYIPALTDNVTIFDTEDYCDADSWIGIFVRENTVELNSLLPYTRYGYYIKTYSTSSVGEQTPIYYFFTASTEPSEPADLIAEAKSDTSILLEWKPPYLFNGLLSHYKIEMFVEEDYLPLIQQRNYCDYPHVSEIKEESKIRTKSLTKPKSKNCTCHEKTFVELVTEDLTCKEGGNKIDNCIKNIYEHRQLVENTKEVDKGNIQKREMEVSNQTALQISTVAANETTYEFKNLHHYTLYIFYLRACNKRDIDGVQCGKAIMVSERTKRRKSADMIRTLKVKVIGKIAHFEWLKPEESNSAVVSYQIEFKRTDSEHSKSIPECITETEYQTDEHEYELSPGKYAVRVQAISLAGPGMFSEWKNFEISSNDSSSFKIYGPIIAIAFFLTVSVTTYYWFKKKRGFPNNHLITSINPDYATYIEDEWEMDRNDIEIIKKLDQGSFGMVYEGLIKSRGYPCAIKTVNENAAMTSKIEFLNEGSVMKAFSDGFHVIKLLGIVSRGQPPLVVMELMERGNLKLYLQRCREPSQNLTTNEMYRMAAEIADGMAYLASKKYVHRDLAARNCMVAADRTVKIGDFGMARDIYETDYYRKETVGLLPVRWMAPESLADGVFTSDSDVWSYGIVLWEMATLAEQPYQGLSNEEVFHFVKARGKLERPNECSELLYEVMDACWMWRPNDRPTFSDIVNKLVDHVGEDFRLVAFCFSRQGLDRALNAGPRVYNPPAMSVAPEEEFGHYDASEEEVNLYIRESNRPTKFLPFSNQRLNKSSPYQISPGSPTSSFSFNSS